MFKFSRRPPQFNRVCNLDDWKDPALTATMRTLLPYFASQPGYPAGAEHRKHWEYAHVVNGLGKLGAVHPEASLLSVAGGHEEPAFHFTNHVRWMYLCDLYGVSGFSDLEARASVLTDPDAFATVPYNRNRLVVQYMNALDLRFDDGMFDGVFCMSSIEHFGGLDGAQRALEEMARVLKPGGIAALTTECIVNGTPDLDLPGLFLFSPRTLLGLTRSIPGLQLVEKPSFTMRRNSLESAHSLHDAVAEAKAGQSRFPHLVLELSGRLFTSVALFFRKRG